MESGDGAYGGHDHKLESQPDRGKRWLVRRVSPKPTSGAGVSF